MQHGGKTVFGATVGILMLETQFPRIVGDMGNALSWDFPVQYRVVTGATPDKVVRNDPTELAELFIDAGVLSVELAAKEIFNYLKQCGYV